MNKLKNIDLIVNLISLMDSSPNAYKVSCIGHVLNPNIKKAMDVSSWNFVNIHRIFDYFHLPL